MNIFKCVAIIIDESRRQNLDGEWNDYWAKKNKKAELRDLKQRYRAERKAIKEKWKHETR